MRVRWAPALLLPLAAAVAGHGSDLAFSPVLPEGVGDVTGWQVVTGDFETANARGAYRLYVNPDRAAMYQLMRYRVELRGEAAAAGGERTDAERVAFIRHPGVREPMACWEKQPPGISPAWRALTAGTEEYKLEMRVLMQVLAVHRAARAAQPSP
jgi:hypothetical protein